MRLPSWSNCRTGGAGAQHGGHEALGDELASLMPTFRRDFANVAEVNRRAIPYLLAANERLKSHDVGINRFVAL